MHVGVLQAKYIGTIWWLSHLAHAKRNPNALQKGQKSINTSSVWLLLLEKFSRSRNNDLPNCTEYHHDHAGQVPIFDMFPNGHEARLTPTPNKP